jgi:25S rRNA (uracil2634-N3)-methyltransferase
MSKYSNAMANLKELEERGCTVLHHVDAHTMNRHPFFHLKLFDRIVFIWPEHHKKRQIK